MLFANLPPRLILLMIHCALLQLALQQTDPGSPGPNGALGAGAALLVVI